MIKANELRIGNWVYFDLHYKQITDFEILEYSSRNGKPISLTPEILEKAGFKKGEGYEIENLYLFLKNCDAFFMFNRGYDILRCWASDGGDTSTVISSINHLHQLQNIYFALVGEELEIKL